MHWCSASKIQATEHERPAVSVPGPAGERVVDDGCPDKDENYGWEHAATVGSGTDGQCCTIHLLASTLFFNFELL